VKRALLAVAAIVVAAIGFKTFQARLATQDAPASRGGDRARNLLLITLDTTRADRIGAYGYAQARTPNLDTLAREGVRFDDAAAQAPITGPSHAAILTGRYPARFGVRDNATTPLPEEATTLAEILAAKGFATGGFVGAFILDRPYGFAQGFSAFNGGFSRVDSGGEANAERRGDAVVSDALSWLRTVPGGQPFFGWVHLYDPHIPYEGGYDGEIAFVDREIGRLIDALRTTGAYERTLVVVIADHGESLGEHGEDEHGVFLYEPVMRVPWIMRGAGAARGHVAREQVRSIDLLPTVLEALGVDRPATLDGESVWALASGGSRATAPASYAESYYPRFHYGWSELRAIRADGWKAIDAPTPELYNLRDDPAEQRNLYASNQALADRMIADAVRIDRDMGGGEAVVAKQPDRETMERLRSLGYVGVTASATRRGERGPDPKDRVDEARQYKTLVSAAIDDLRGGNPSAAEQALRALVARNDRAYDLHILLAEAYERQTKLPQALGEYEVAALLNPSSVTPLIAAADVRLAMGDPAGARRTVERAAAIEAGAFDVLFVTGRLLEAEGKPAEAIAAYERAVRVNGSNPRARRQLSTLAARHRRFDVAEPQLRALLAMGYQPSRTHVALGQIAQMRGATAEAAQHYREALRLEPGLTMARQALASLGGR
jgi:tetratricopeptide (TPR) repeat protein